jgi:pilus assembly protein Flp/PilA
MFPRGGAVRFPTPSGPMKNLLNKVAAFLKKEDGPTAVEYAVMLSLIIVVCIIAITSLGQSTSQTFSYVGSQIKPVAS